MSARVLCIADIRGRLSALNDYARENNATAIIHTGDFGFFQPSSLDQNAINDRTLRHLTMYSPLIPSIQRQHLLSQPDPIRPLLNISLLSEFPLLLNAQIKLDVPVYTVWGACEDVRILENFRQGTYNIPNLHIIDEATSHLLDLSGIKLRLFGLGGALVPHKMFDNGDGSATIAGGQGTMWTTALQIGELVDTAQRAYDPTETRLLVSHTSPGREGIIAQLALVLKADLTLSAGLHFRYATSYNEFSIQSDFDGFRRKLEAGKQAFDKVWDSVRPQVEAVMDDHQKVLMDKALSVVERIPAPSAGEDPAWKNCWNWNLCDAAYGSLVLDIKEGRISADLKSQGFNYAYRRTATTTSQTPSQPPVTLPPSTNLTQAPTPAPPAAAAAPDLKGVSSPPATGGKNSPVPKPNGAGADRAEREKAKKKDKKDKKDREKAEKQQEKEKEKEKEKEEAAGTDAKEDLPSEASGPGPAPGPKSPTTETGSTGVRTPKTGKPQRNPWTIFMRMPASMTAQPTEADVKEFFGDAGAKDKIMKIHWPVHYQGRPRIAYVEFEDEEAMKAGIDNHADKLNDTIIEVKQAQDRDQREGHGHGHAHGGSGGRGGTFGRARGRATGAYAARGFAAAGLTRGGFRGNGHSNGGSGGGSAPAPTAAET